MPTDDPKQSVYLCSMSAKRWREAREEYSPENIDVYDQLESDWAIWFRVHKERWNIRTKDFLGMLFGDPDSISSVCLAIIAAIEAREEVLEGGASHAQSRGYVISDSFISTVISQISTRMIRNNVRDVPADFLALLAIFHGTSKLQATRKVRHISMKRHCRQIKAVIEHFDVEPTYRLIAQMAMVDVSTVSRAFPGGVLLKERLADREDVARHLPAKESARWHTMRGALFGKGGAPQQEAD